MSVTCNLYHVHLPVSFELCTVEDNINNLHNFQDEAVYPKLHVHDCVFATWYLLR